MIRVSNDPAGAARMAKDLKRAMFSYSSLQLGSRGLERLLFFKEDTGSDGEASETHSHKCGWMCLTADSRYNKELAFARTEQSRQPWRRAMEQW